MSTVYTIRKCSEQVYYYLQLALRSRDIEEIMLDRNAPVDHTIIQR